jgi:hypothetical protein
VGVRYSAREEVEQLTDRALTECWIREREVVLDLVTISPAVTCLDDVPGIREVGDDAKGTPLGDAERRGNVPQTRARVSRNAQQCVRMVGEEVPFAHSATLA